MSNGVLIEDFPDDSEFHDGYILPEDMGGVWIEVRNLVVHIVPTDEGVVVDIYPNGREADDALDSCYAFFKDAEEENNG